MTLSIRRATLNDAPIVAEYNAALAWETEQKRLRADVLAAGVRAVFADPARGFYLVAEKADVGETPAPQAIGAGETPAPQVTNAGETPAPQVTNAGETPAPHAIGSVVGQMMVTYEWSDWRNGWFWWVQSVYVREDARRSGVFRALYHESQRLASADPTVIGLRLYVERENARARATYRALGMTETTYGLMEEYPLPGRTSDIGVNSDE